jgi:hypothetical protein
MNSKKFRILSATMIALLAGGPSVSFASPKPIEQKFANCTELNSVYPGGVAKNSKVTNKGGITKSVPVVKPSIYKKNASKDRDKDGIACEK